MTPPPPTIVVLAGPNGAGKSTFFELFLKESGLPFIDADLIARAIAPEDPAGASSKAATVADAQRKLLVERGESFCIMETVFSDPIGSKLGLLRDARQRGYCVRLVFIGLESAALSLARVIERVEGGGHDVPADKVRERYPRTLQNLEAAIPQLDEVTVYDNSDANEPYRLVARFEHGVAIELADGVPDWVKPVLPR